MMLELRGKNGKGSKRNESLRQSEEDSEGEVSQNHLKKLENMAKKIHFENKTKKETKSEKKEEEIKNPKKQENRKSPKGKSIVPSESYAQNIGFGRQVNSPLLSAKSQSKLKPKTPKEKDNEKEDPKSNSPIPLKKVDPRSLNYAKKQIKSIPKKKQISEMIHTPNPKATQYNRNLVKKKKSHTPEPKAASNLLNNINRETLITEELKDRKYCLVLDLDETLIHFKNDNGRAKFLIRPYTYNFLRNLESHFELIIFTAAQKEYADWILDKIDNKVGLIRDLFRTGFTEHIVS